MMSPATVVYPNHAPLQPIVAIDLFKEKVESWLCVTDRDNGAAGIDSKQLH